MSMELSWWPDRQQRGPLVTMRENWRGRSRTLLLWKVALSPVALVVLAGGVIGCSNVEPVAPHNQITTDPTQLYMSLALDQPAVNITNVQGANTLRLTATPRDALGHPMSGLPVPTFRSTDTTAVLVDSSGLLTALRPASGVLVIATVALGPVSHTDTARINVTTVAPSPVDSLSIHPVPPDSAKWPALMPGGLAPGLFQGLLASNLYDITSRLRVTDASGNSISGLVVTYSSLDPGIAAIDRWQGVLKPRQPGQVHVVAQTWAYGVPKADTVAMTLTLPVVQEVHAGHGVTGAIALLDGAGAPTSDVQITPYGIVGWLNQLTDTVDITFDNMPLMIMPPDVMCTVLGAFGLSTACDTSNIVLDPFDPTTSRTGYALRQFPTPGVYPFHSVRTGLSGRVVVVAGQ